MPILANLLINEETGAIDHDMVEQCAQARAAREYGAPNFPPRVLREARSWSIDRARIMRTNWQQQRGLPADEPAEMVNVPAWGNSGDSF